MNISLDYDGTYTEDPAAWDAFIDAFQAQGHTIYMVTMRKPSEANKTITKLSQKIQVIFTERQAKHPFVEKLGLEIDVWIDDNPLWIFQSSF